MNRQEREKQEAEIDRHNTYHMTQVKELCDELQLDLVREFHAGTVYSISFQGKEAFHGGRKLLNCVTFLKGVQWTKEMLGK